MIEFTRESEAVIALARHEAGQEKIGPEHLLLAMVEHEHNLGAQAILHGPAAGWGPTQCHAAFRRKIDALKETKQGTRRAYPGLDGPSWGEGPSWDEKVSTAPPEETGEFDFKEILPTLGRIGAILLEDLTKWARK